MGTLRTKTIEPATGSTLTLGASGDTITVNSDSIKTNTFKDAGGNTLFTSDGAGTLSSVNAGLKGGNGPVLISTSTASGASSVDITSGITSTYDEYMFVMTDINPATDGTSFCFQVNAVGQTGFNETCTSTFIRAYHGQGGQGPGFSYQGDTTDQALGTALQQISEPGNALGNASDECFAGILHLFRPANTTYVKHFYSAASMNTSPSGQGINYNVYGYCQGYFSVTAAITEIRFIMSSGNMDGTIQMYGLK